MSKIINLIQEKLKTLNIINNKDNKTTFFITIITALVVHFQLYSLMITGADTLIDNMYHQADIWETMLLRFGLAFVQQIKGNIVSPVLVTIISSVFLAITVLLVIEILGIKNKFLKYITGCVFAVAPNISATFTFFYCSDAYMLGMLLATLAVFIIKKYEKPKWVVLISGLCISISMGMYQTYLSVTMVLCIATLIIDVLSNKEKKQIYKSAVKYIIMGVIGVALFYIISRMVLIYKNFPMSNYNGADKIGLQTLLDLPKLLPQAYKSFFNYYFTDTIIPNTIWHTNIIYSVIFITMLVSSIYLIIKNKVYKKISNLVILLILFFIIPICFDVIEIIVPDVSMHILMACSMIFIFPIFFKIIDILPKTTLSKVFKYIIIVCSVIVIWNYIWQDNASYIAMNSMQKQAESTALKLVTRIEQLDEYNPKMPILILGGLRDNPYLKRENTSIEAKKIFERTWGFISNEPTIWWGNLDSWQKIFYEYVGVNLKVISEHEEQSQKKFETEEYKSILNIQKKTV